MKLKRISKQFNSVFLLAGVLAIANPVTAYAATINLSPSSGTYPATRPFSVAMVINEQTDSFNAAQAGVTVSNNLTVADLVLGDCGFSFVKTPTIQDPSYVGVLLGSSKKSCTVYTLTLIPSGSDDGTVTLSDASVKRYGDAKELITAVSLGKYSVGSASIGTLLSEILPNNTTDNQLIPVTNAAATIQSGQDQSAYTVDIKVTDDSNNPLKNATVQLSPQLQAKDTAQQTTTTNDKGVATFKGVSPNVYTVEATSGDKLIAQAVFNAKGSNQQLTLGIHNERPQTPFPLIIGVMFAVAALIFFIRTKVWTYLYRSNKDTEVS
jgi:hypothetical protein